VYERAYAYEFAELECALQLMSAQVLPAFIALVRHFQSPDNDDFSNEAFSSAPIVTAFMSTAAKSKTPLLPKQVLMRSRIILVSVFHRVFSAENIAIEELLSER
jgi:hypothetical protein